MDVRWFSPNRYCALPVPALRVAAAFEYSRRHQANLARELEAVLAQRSSRPAVQPSILAPLTISACAARLLPGLMRLLGRAP